jgi:hypothetical protein
VANWQLDPVTWTFVDEAATRPRLEGYTWQEFHEQERPPCPACFAVMEVNPVRVRTLGSGEPLYLPGTIACPNGCTPG